MAMETSMPIGVKSVQQTKSTDNTQVVRRDSGSAPFTPQTNVSLQNAVNDMAGVLMKIATHQETAVEAMPEQIKQMVENVLRQAFSLDATLGEGIGSTMESQRFSVEQLSTLARLLGQLGNFAEKNGFTELSSDVQAFMKCLREHLSGTDKSFEPVLLHKLSFQMLDSKGTDELSPEMQMLLLSPNNMPENFSVGNRDSLLFLKQLIKCFLPTPKQSVESEHASAVSIEQTADDMGGQPKENVGLSRMIQTDAEIVPAPGKFNTMSEKNTSELSDDNSVFNGSDVPETENMQDIEGNLLNNYKSEVKNSNAEGAKPFKTRSESDQIDNGYEKTIIEHGVENSQESNMGKGLQKAKAALEQVQNLRQQIAANREATHSADNNNIQKGNEMSAPLENSPKTMETMKNLAGLLLKDASLTEEETVLLQKFINGEQVVLTEKDAKQLQLLLRLCESNVPASVRQAARNNKMPDLPKLWAFMELCDLASLKEQTPHTLRSASRHVADFAASMRGQMEGEGTNNIQGERSMNFMMPLYLGENEKNYPAYIHVYDEEKQHEDAAAPAKETWLRICLLTENIGAVELTCRVYDKSKLDVRVIFSQSDAVQGFKEYLPEFRASFRESSLQLSDLKIGVVGAKV